MPKRHYEVDPRVLTVFFFLIVLGAFSSATAQDLSQITAVWEQTIAALNQADSGKAKELRSAATARLTATPTINHSSYVRDRCSKIACVVAGYSTVFSVTCPFLPASVPEASLVRTAPN
jgi:energy-coupling factor transporter transmembrane protein EcfT